MRSGPSASTMRIGSRSLDTELISSTPSGPLGAGTRVEEQLRVARAAFVGGLRGQDGGEMDPSALERLATDREASLGQLEWELSLERSQVW